MNYYTAALKKYATFEGRASMAEYWYFALFNVIIVILLGEINGYDPNGSLLKSFYGLFMLLPSFAVGVRRMHDVNKSGWFILIPCYNLLLLVRKGDKVSNRYGAVPFVTKNSDDSEMSNYCNKCGASVETNSKFCVKCGNRIT